MKTSVAVGSSHKYRLKSAMLLYGAAESDYDDPHPFATLHDVCEEESGGARLLPGRLVRFDTITSFLRGLGQESVLEILPESVIARNAETLMWWAPAATRRMFFGGRGSKDETLRKLSGKSFPHPPLLFRASGTHLWIRALKENKRPQASSALYIAPYWNCYDNGVVCTGSMEIPKRGSVTAISVWEHSFFASAFTHAAGVKKHTSYPGGVLALWKELQGQAEFPVKYLVSADETVTQLMKTTDTSYGIVTRNGQ